MVRNLLRILISQLGIIAVISDSSCSISSELKQEATFELSTIGGNFVLPSVHQIVPIWAGESPVHVFCKLRR